MHAWPERRHSRSCCSCSRGAPGAPAAQVAPQPCSPAVAITGFSDALDGASYGTRRTYPPTGLSGLAVDRDGDLLVLSDRSVLFTLDPRNREPTRAVPLFDEDGRPLDAEALAVDADGTRLVTSAPSSRPPATAGCSSSNGPSPRGSATPCTSPSPPRAATPSSGRRSPTSAPARPSVRRHSRPQANPLLDNVEGMTVLGRTLDGALRVLLVSDDNQNTDQTTRLYDLEVQLPPA